MVAQSWEALNAAGLPDYLRAVGVIRQFEVVSASRSSGRNRVFRVSAMGRDRPSWFVKQFGSGDYDGAAFKREREITTSLNSNLAVFPVHADDEWRVLVFPAFGESLYEKVRSGGTISSKLGSVIRENLGALRAHPVNTPHDLPAILRWLALGFDDGNLSIAQRRLATTLKHNSSVSKAAHYASEAWSEEASNSVFCHGDLKLEHVLVSGMNCRCIDWEFARSGPPEWDLAGLVQSVLAYVVLGLINWHPSTRQLLLTLVANVDIENSRFAEWVALRLWQTAIEWETDRVQLSEGSGQLCQLGVNLVRDSGRLSQLLDSDA